MGKFYSMTGLPVCGQKRKDAKQITSSFLCEVFNNEEGRAIIGTLKLVAKSRGERLILRGRHPNRLSLPYLNEGHDVPIRYANTIRVYFGVKNRR